MEPKKYQSWYKQFQSQGNTKNLKEFCKDRRINYTLFSKWVQSQRLQAKEVNEQIKILPLRLSLDSLPVMVLENVTLKLTNGMIVQLTSLDIPALSCLIKTLSE